MQFNKHGNNSSGFGKLHNPNICDLKSIENLYNNLKNKTVIKNQDYLEFLKNVKKGDFIYLDPPYVPDDIKGCSIKYSSEIWNIDDFNNLVKLCEDLDKRVVNLCYQIQIVILLEKFSKNNYNIKKSK